MTDRTPNRTPNKNYRRSPKKKNRFLKKIIIFLFILIIIISIGVIYVFSSVQKQLSKTYVDNRSNSEINSKKPLSILLMGVDTGDGERGGSLSWNGNSDSQIILTLNPKDKSATMISMQRDTMTNIINENNDIISTQKMNAAYPIGYNKDGINGASEFSMKTIGEQSGINIDNFIAMNMDGLVNLVDDVGGIDVINNSGGDIYISNTEPQYTARIPFIGEGKFQHINGEQALVFSRDRDHLPNGDYGRSQHQREVLQQLVKKLSKFNNISTYQKFIKSISNDFKTDISLDLKNVMSLLSYKDCFDKIISIQYEGVGSTAIDSQGTYASFQFIPTDVYLAINNAMKKSINQTDIATLNSNIITYEKHFGTVPPFFCLPSASVTEAGKTTKYGVNTSGEFVTIDKENQNLYV